MSCSPAQLAANRANALKSTGPRTKRGKRKASRNSMKHAWFCEQAVVPGESKILFELMRQKFIRDLKPQNDVELSIVDRIATGQWKLRRIQSAEMAFYRQGYETFATKVMDHLEENDFDEKVVQKVGEHVSQDPDMPGHIALEGISGDLDKISRMEQRLEMSIHRWMRELERVRKLSEKSEDMPRSDYDMLDETIEESAAMARKERRQRKAKKEAEKRTIEAVVDACEKVGEEDESEATSIEPLNAPGTGETPVSRGGTSETGESASLGSTSQEGGPQESTSDESASDKNAPAEYTSNIQNEANDLFVRYTPVVVELRRERRAAKEVETKPMPVEAVETRDQYAARMAALLERPVEAFDGMSKDEIGYEVGQFMIERARKAEEERMALARERSSSYRAGGEAV